MNGSHARLKQRLHRHEKRLTQRLAWLQRRSAQLSRLRLTLFLAATAASLFTLFQFGIWFWAGVSLPALVPFLVSVSRHRRVQAAIMELSLWRTIKRTHAARITLDWSQIPPTLPVPPRSDHPFALDLDVIGHRSLHRLLDTAVSHAGSERLRQWLSNQSPDPETIFSRQELVQELMAMPRFRDRLVLYATLAAAEEPELESLARDKWPGQRLIAWLEGKEEAGALRPILLLLGGLAAVNLPLLLLYFAGVLPPVWLLVWVPFILISGAQVRKAGPVFKDASFVADSLRQLQAVFGFLENERYAGGEGIRTLCQPFLTAGKRPSAQLRRVNRIISGAGVQYNPVLWFLLNAVVPWDIYFAYRMRQARRELRVLLPVWLDVWYELEALCALATFASLNPGTTFPQIDPAVAPPFRASNLGHPLIPYNQRICNDFTVPGLGNITIITGSNMSGKSSFLRTLGVNLALAYAGGPVVAGSFHTALFRLYTSIQVTDSVTDGFSFFYAEVRRLQAMLAALKDENELPLLFLIDEIFRGTNNRERLLGSRAYVRELVGKRGIGVIATHDLELVHLADESDQIRNFHFRDDVQNGRMVFDYKLYPGPCPTTNALKIMRLAGLPVPEDKV